jgi:hypothetical protein
MAKSPSGVLAITIRVNQAGASMAVGAGGWLSTNWWAGSRRHHSTLENIS